MYSHSLKWKSSGLKEREQRTALNKARSSLCPESFVWTRNFDIAEHRLQMSKLYATAKDKRVDESMTHDEDRILQSSIRPAMSSYTWPTFTATRSAVLAQTTIFDPSANRSEEVPWPCKEEMEYEGDARIKTEKLHARMLPTPRIHGNDTVAWMHRSFIIPEALDDFRVEFDEVAIFLRNHYVSDLEFTDEEGQEVLGSAMMKALDPVDCF